MITVGSVVVARFPYLDDSTQSKVRCGVVISEEEYHDLFERRRYILAFISSIVPNEILDGWEFVIEEGTELFNNSGLRKRSVIKAHRIVALQTSIGRNYATHRTDSLIAYRRNSRKSYQENVWIINLLRRAQKLAIGLLALQKRLLHPQNFR